MLIHFGQIPEAVTPNMRGSEGGLTYLALIPEHRA